jgi:Aerotolerance regulator N-terminal
VSREALAASRGFCVSLFAITGLPILLTGAALVGLPVLLHLIMRQEPKRLPFPAFRFLKLQRRVNQRKIRLRHLLLLLLRMALIALICLSLFQPTMLSEGFSIRGDRPIAAVVVLDTSPSMGYVLAERTGLTEARQRGLKLLDEPAEGPWTCLDEARGRAMEILDELPSGSKVAVLDTADWSEPVWEVGLNEARQRVRDIKKPRANSKPVTRTLESAYALLARADSELEPGQEPYPRLLAVFSDRTAASWDQSRTAELQSLRDRVPPPSVYHVYVDVGVDKPVNTAITTVEMRPQIIPANQPAVINVTVESTTLTDNILLFSVDGEEPQRVPVNPGPERPISRQLRKDGLKPGLHHAKIGLLTADALPFDNERFVTFRVREPRHVLALVDQPPESLLTGGLGLRGTSVRRALLWKEALDSVGWYDCDVRPVPDDRDLGQVEWSRYEQITLLGLANPSATLWSRIADYVQKGGHLIVVPGGPEMNADAYRKPEAAARVLPQKFDRWVALPAGETVTWTWSALSPERPLLSVFRQYREHSDFFDKTPPITWGYWKVEGANRERVVVSYNDAPDPDERSPAVLEWGPPRGGRVIQFTVPMASGSDRVSNNYATSWFYLVLVNEAVRVLVGDTEDQAFNFTAGQNVILKWPPGDVKPGASYFLSGPDVSATDAVVRREEGQPFFRWGPEKTTSAGNFTLQSEDGAWTDGFGVNAPVEESNLERLAPEAINELFGPETLFPADKKLTLAGILSGKFTQPIELFPFLMILLLLVLAVENLLANKFYRRKGVRSL